MQNDSSNYAMEFNDTGAFTSRSQQEEVAWIPKGIYTNVQTQEFKTTQPIL
jgi:hypothetical protein